MLRLKVPPIPAKGAARLDQAVAEEARPAVAVPRRGLVLMAALMAIFLPAVESSIVATALPTIIGHLGGAPPLRWEVLEQLPETVGEVALPRLRAGLQELPRVGLYLATGFHG